MIEIIKVEDQLGEGVYTMKDNCAGAEPFLVRVSQKTKMIKCPICHMEFALFIIIGNYNGNKRLAVEEKNE